MIDCEAADLVWTSPGKRKRKKDSKKKRKEKNNQIKETNGSTQKKKKKKDSKVKGAVEEKTAKRKGKKKKKPTLGVDGSFIFTQESVASHPVTQAKPDAKPRSTEKPETQDSKKKSKRKKKVAFDLSPDYIRVKRPKCIFSSLQSPEESTLLVNGAVRGVESCSQVTMTGPSRCQALNDDSQCTSDDMHSQDLFITQKTFRVPPSQTSSGETSDKADPMTPTQPHRLTSVPKTGSRDPQVYQRKVNESKPQKTNTLQVLFKQEEDDGEKENMFFQTQMESNTASCLLNVKPSVTNPYLDVPIVADTCRDSVESKILYKSLIQMSSSFTQTENFFTTELSSCLSFCQKNRGSAHSEDAKPLDLSLPHRARKDLGRCLKTSVTEVPEHQDKNVNKGDSRKEPDLKDAEVSRESCSRHLCSVGAQGKGQTPPSPQSESEPKSTDTTGSSEDNEASCRGSRLDLMQVRAVQMRLNESFFFKTKGEGQSPRPESPLMKLTQSREAKCRKGK